VVVSKWHVYRVDDEKLNWVDIQNDEQSAEEALRENIKRCRPEDRRIFFPTGLYFVITPDTNPQSIPGPNTFFIINDGGELQIIPQKIEV
jgi:DNA modification methylase